MRRILLFLFTLLAFSGCLLAQDYQVKIQPGKLVFKLKPEYRQAVTNNQVRNDKLRQALSAIGANAVTQKYPRAYVPENNPEAVDLTLLYQVKLNEKTDLNKALQTLKNTGLLAYAEPLRSYEPLYQPNDPRSDSTTTTSLQYYLKNIRAYRAWDFEKGDSTIVIGILDTGIRFTHQDLKGNIKKNYADKPDGLDNDNDGFVDNHRGWDTADNDNDATDTQSGHGTAVTGLAAASTDNGKIMAGVGFKSKFLPVKIFPTSPTGSFGGYEGIVYAADHGCSIINLSWGGYSTASEYEQDVVNYASVNRNVLLVAAAGNTNAQLNFLPSSYANVLSVGTLSPQGIKNPSNTYSHQIDISAPGESIVTLNIGHDSSIVRTAGSSMACPMVAGAAALVKHKFPGYTAAQIGEQIRATANSSIYALPGNANYQGMLGSGQLDVARAVTTTNAKSVRFTRVQVDKKDLIYPSDTINLIVDFRNYLAPLSNLNVTVSAVSPYITVLQGTYAAGAMATLTNKTNTVPFRLKIAANTPVNAKLALKFTFSDGTYTDFQYFETFLNPDYVTLNINKLAVTVTSTGNIGFKDLDPQVGGGVHYKKTNLLSEGGLMVGNSPTVVSDNIRFQAFTDTDFRSITNAHFVNALPRTDQEVQGMMQDSFPQSAGTLGVNITYKGYAWQNAPKDKFVILEYRISNPQATTLSNVYAGMFTDWDLPDSGHNRAVWDAANKMGYSYNVLADTIYAAVKLLSSGVPSFYAIDNFNPPPGSINLADGFTNAEKFQALSGGVARATAGSPLVGNDVSFVIGEKLPDLLPNQSSTLAVAIIAGNNLADIQASAQAAQLAYTQRALGTKNQLANAGISVYPNPVRELLHVQIPSDFGAAKLQLTDALGRIIGVKTGKASETLSFNTEKLAAGMYFMKVETSKGSVVQKIQVVK